MTPPVVTPGRARVVLAAAAVAVVAIVGCGDDEGGAGVEESGSTPAPEADLTVEAHDNDFDRDEYTVAPGEQRVSYLQEGEIRHTLLVETADGTAVDGFELEVDGSPSDAGTVDLEAGRYTFYCDVAGHREAGMEADLVVE
jgi:plastocyanin